MAQPKPLELVPSYRRDTYRAIRGAYPDGVPPDEYDPLLYVLYVIGGMSYRAVAHMLDDCGVQDYFSGYHDVLRVHSQKDAIAPAAKPVLEKLIRHGYDPTAE